MLIVLLMILSLGVILSPPKQIWAQSESQTSIINTLIETFGPKVFEYLTKDNSEGTGTGGPPDRESPAPPDPTDPTNPPDPCADPGPELEGLCGGYQPDSVPYRSSDPCSDPALADLCGGSQLGILPYGSNDPTYNPLLVLQQFWGDFERVLSYLPPQDRSAMLSEFRLMIEQGLAPYPSEQQQEAIQMLKQTMSPELSKVLLPT